MVGPRGVDGQESFDIVCTPKWLLDHHDRNDIVTGRHLLIVFEYSYERLLEKISSLCIECSGQTWQELAVKLGRWGKWEFEDYQS
jgi:hypothetical protein